METRVGSRKSTSARTDEIIEPAAEPAAKRSGASRAKQPAPELEHSRGSRQLVQRRKVGALSVSPFSPLVVEKRHDRDLPPGPDGSLPWVKVTSWQELAKAHYKQPPAPPPPPKVTPRVMPMPQAPLHFHMEMRAKYDAAVEKFESTKRALEQSARLWDEIAKQRRQPPPPGTMGTLEDTLMYAERQADAAREALRDLKIEHGAIKFELETVLGMAKGTGIRAPRPVDPNKDPQPKKKVQSELERMREKLQGFNDSIDRIKSSGVLAPPIAAAYVAAVELSGRKLQEREYKNLDVIYGSGAVTNVALRTATAKRGPSGAASPAPGVDHRARVQSTQRQEIRQAHQPVRADR